VRLRILTLNAWALPWPLSDRPDARMEAIGGQLASLDADIVAFQEAWSPSARRKLTEAGRRAGYTETWSQPGSIGSSGMLVLSRLPIREARFIRFALCGFPEDVTHGDYYGGKGIAVVTLETPEGPVALLSTHLIPHYGDYGPEDTYMGHRVGEVVELSDALAQIDIPAIVVGDFNFTEREPEYEILMGLSGLTDLAVDLEWREVTIVPGPPYRANESPPGVRIDYVFARDGADRSVAPQMISRVLDETIEIDGKGAGYSDHAGLLAEIEIHRGQTVRPPPSVDAVARAAALLRESRGRAEHRRRDQLGYAAGGGVVALAAVGSVSMAPVSRRRLLRAALIGLPAIALGMSAGAGLLASQVVARELAGHDKIDRLLEDLRRGAVESARQRGASKTNASTGFSAWRFASGAVGS
jgi:endonuclease/exonuclease/phosphatase family metal-dependent hydrolase